MAEKPERRELSFQDLDQALADAKRLVEGDVRTTGNHTFGQILEHLARSLDMSSGKIEAPRPPWYMRLMVKLMKSTIINSKPLTPGFKLPASAEAFFWPNQEFSVTEAFEHLREATENYKANGPLAKHPVFGNLSEQQALELNCRHAALHLSFVHPTA